jgi:hypothetical protein
METFSPLLEADAVDAQLVGAIAEIMNEGDIVVLESFRGLDKLTGELITTDRDIIREARIYVEWIRRKGRFGLDLNLFGPGVREDVSGAELARALAQRLGAPVLMSDCSHFGFSWLKHDPSGAIWEVVSDTADIEDFDLLCDLDRAHPNFCPAQLVWAAGTALPLKAAPPGAGWRACKGEGPGSSKLCRIFCTPFCPKALAFSDSIVGTS